MGLYHVKLPCLRSRSVMLRCRLRCYTVYIRPTSECTRLATTPAHKRSNPAGVVNWVVSSRYLTKGCSNYRVQHRASHTEAYIPKVEKEEMVDAINNSAVEYECIHIRPLSSAMGAEITNVDLSTFGDSDSNNTVRSTSSKNRAFQEIRQALFKHKMIYFRNQSKLTHTQHQSFAAMFGPFARDAYPSTIIGCEHIKPVIKDAHTKVRMVFGSGWHTDSPFLAEPPHVTTLRSVCIPPYGGDTIFANTSLAYSKLSKTMQGILEPLRVHMSLQGVLNQAQVDAGEDESTPLGRLAATKHRGLSKDVIEGVKGTVHKLVGVHPITQEKALFIDGTYTVGIDGLSEQESNTITNFLLQHITQPAFGCRLRWEPDMVVVWDNRLCIHQAMNDYDGYRRELYRTTNRCL